MTAVAGDVTAKRLAGQSERPEVEVITLTDAGFDPTEIKRPAGRVLLAINNKTGLDHVLLRLGLDGGRTLHTARINRGDRNLRRIVDLAPGDYVLSEAGHPEWVCRITITD